MSLLQNAKLKIAIHAISGRAMTRRRPGADGLMPFKARQRFTTVEYLASGLDDACSPALPYFIYHGQPLWYNTNNATTDIACQIDVSHAAPVCDSHRCRSCCVFQWLLIGLQTYDSRKSPPCNDQDKGMHADYYFLDRPRQESDFIWYLRQPAPPRF